MALPKLSRKDFARVIEIMLTHTDLRKAWVYANGGKVAIRATRQFRFDGRRNRESLVLSYGAPSWREKRDLAGYRKRRIPIPKFVLVQHWSVEGR